MRRDNSLFNFIIAIGVVVSVVFSGVLDQFIPDKLLDDPEESSNNSDKGENSEVTLEDLAAKDSTNGFFTRIFVNALIKALKTPEGKKVIAQMLDADKSRYKNQSEYNLKYENFGLIEEHFKVQSLKEGEGRSAQCGDKVKIKYKINEKTNEIPRFVLNATKNQNYKKSSETLDEYEVSSIYLGEEKLKKQAENIIVGMRPGGVRYGELRVEADKIDPAEDYPKFWVELIDVTPVGEIDTSNTEMFDDLMASEMPLICGDKVKINMSLHKFDGTTLIGDNSENNPFKMKIGSTEAPYDLSRFLYGKFRSGRRVIITPGKNLHEINKISGLGGLSLSPEEFYMLKISDVTLGE
jgi:hypothetical protein